MDHWSGERYHRRLSEPHLMIVRMGSWSAREERSVTASEDISWLSRALLAHTRSIMLGPRVGKSERRVRVRSWDSAHKRKGSASGDDCAKNCQAGCWILKSSATRQGRDDIDCSIRMCKSWPSSTKPWGALYMLMRRTDFFEVIIWTIRTSLMVGSKETSSDFRCECFCM